MPSNDGRRTAFVFAGGGSLGAVEVGMLKALVAHGERPDFVVGASVGAINAAYYAGAPDMAGVERLDRIWRRLRTRLVFPFSPVQGLLGVLGWGDNLSDPTPLRRLLERMLPLRRLDDGPIPCHVVATDVLAGVEVVLSTGPTVPALLASAAIPGVFPPVALDGRHLIDGGVASNTPIDAAIDRGARRVIVLPTGHPCTLSAPPHGALALALHALTLMISRQLVVDIERLRARADIAVVPPLCPLDVSAYDFSATDTLIDRAEAATRKWLAAGGLERPLVPAELRPHGHGADGNCAG